MHRSLVSFLLFLLIPASFLFSQTNAEEEAVKSVVTAVTQAATRQSWADIAATSFILDDQTVLLFQHSDGKLLTLGKDDLLKSTTSPATGASSSLANVRIVVIDQASSVSFDETLTAADGRRTLLHAMWFLEKKDGVWKVHVLSYHTVSAPK